MSDELLTTRLLTYGEAERRIARLGKLASAPIVLYGAGTYALEVAGLLNHLNLAPAGAFVDASFPLDSELDVDVIREVDLDDRYPRCNSVIAFMGDPHAAKARVLAAHSGVSLVEIVDGRRWRQFAHWRTEHESAGLELLESLSAWLVDEMSRQTLNAFMNAKLTFDPRGLRLVWTGDQYFPASIPGFSPRQSDVFVDCGAFTGDTLQAVVGRTGGAGCARYLALEPDPLNAELLRHYVATSGSRAEVIEAGAWAYAGRLPFRSGKGTSSSVDPSSLADVMTVAVDDLDVPATFIKMDIEGAELEALRGASATIRKHAPRLAVAVYHRPEDLFLIPQYIASLRPDYRFYLRSHSYYSEELVLYASTDDA